MNSLQAVPRPCLHLEVTVLRGRNISSGTFHDLVNKPDPYVKLYIPTAPNGLRKTKPQSNTDSPIWNETFDFFLDSGLKNKLVLTLMDSDLVFDDLMGTKTFNLNSLTLDQSHSQTFFFKKGSEVDVEMKVKKSTLDPDMRLRKDLCDQENDFCEERKLVVLKAMSNVLEGREPKDLDEVPTVAILGSGGGFRAMVGFSGVFCALKDLGILDCAMYTAGVSGSTWYLSTLYSHPDWPSIDPREIRDEIRDNIKDNLLWKLISPSWLWEHYKLIVYKRKRGQPVSFTDLFGHLVAEALLNGRETIPKLSEQKKVVQYGQVPLPLYACVNVKKDVSAQKHCEWVEFSPYEIGIAKHGTFVKTEQFGSKFFCGMMVTKYEEQPLHYLQGLWGNAFAILFQRVLLDHNEKTIEAMKNADDPRGELEEMIDSDNFEDDEESDVEEEDDAWNKKCKKLETKNVKSGLLSSLLAKLLEKLPVMKTRQRRAGLIHNFLRGLQLLASPFPGGDQKVTDGNDDLTSKAKRIFLVDAGVDFNSPYPLVLRPQRNVDVILSFDFSNRERDEQIDFKALLLAEKWARENNLKFPPIDIEAQFNKNDIKECYVFRDPNDRACPIVVHFTLINKTFRQYSSPEVPRKTEQEEEYANFSIFEDPGKDYHTFNLRYTEKSFNRLADLCEFNTRLCEETIKDVLAESVRNKRARKVKNVKN